VWPRARRPQAYGNGAGAIRAIRNPAMANFAKRHNPDLLAGAAGERYPPNDVIFVEVKAPGRA
jgi:hypothetical protein